MCITLYKKCTINTDYAHLPTPHSHSVAMTHVVSYIHIYNVSIQFVTSAAVDSWFARMPDVFYIRTVHELHFDYTVCLLKIDQCKERNN